jgi:O-antigen ligase
MLDKLFGYKVHAFLQLLGLIILSVGLPLNKVVMSIGTIWLASNIVLKADIKTYWQNWKSSRLARFIVVILCFHLIGLLYTEDFGYAFHDLNAKLPFFTIPLCVIAFPIKREWLNYVLYFFVTSLFITSCINFFMALNSPLPDFRSMSLFGSHIRYTLLVVMGVAVALHLLLTTKKLRIIWVLLMGWFLFYIYQSQVFSGYISLFALVLSVLIYFLIVTKSNVVKTTLSVGLLAVFGLVIYLVVSLFSFEKTITDFSNLPNKTPYGNVYVHDTMHTWLENGHHVRSYISEKELREAWNKRADIDYDTLLNEHEKLSYILWRYMSSLGLTKDLDGMKKMSEADIQNVQRGFTNIDQVSGSPMARWGDLKNQFRIYGSSGDPNGNSLTERIEHFKVGWMIVKDNWKFGVGTGDVQLAFDLYYEKSGSKLDESAWNRAHNQFLTFWITFGIFGLLLFLSLWIYLLWLSIRHLSFLSTAFVFIAFSSFLIEDTIETQQGVTFVAFFLAAVFITTQTNRKCLNEST